MGWGAASIEPLSHPQPSRGNGIDTWEFHSLVSTVPLGPNESYYQERSERFA